MGCVEIILQLVRELIYIFVVMLKTILIADDHKITQLGLKVCCDDLFNNEVEYVICSSLKELLEAVKSNQHFDLIILDNFLYNDQTISAVDTVVASKPDSPILFVSMANEEIFGVMALKSGAKGYVSKNANDEELQFAIRKVINGGMYFSDSVLKVFEDVIINKKFDFNPFSKLSSQEYKICLMLIQGMRTKEISIKLQLSYSTVSTFKFRIFEKLGTNNLSDIIKLAEKYQIVD